MADDDITQYRNGLTKLQREDQLLPALNEIKNLFLFRPTGASAVVIKTVGFVPLIRRIDTADDNQTDLICDALKACFGQLNIGDVTREFTGYLMFMLRHQKQSVRKLAIEEVHKTITANPNLLPVSEYIDVFVAISQMVVDKDIGVVKTAILITSNLPQDVYPIILEEMKIALEYNSNGKSNAFEVITNISCKSYDLFKLSVDTNYIDFMLNELNSSDYLFQLNILELLSRLAVTPHGVNYMVKKGTLENIARMLKTMSNNPLGGILTPGKWFVYELAGVGYIKFFGCIAHHYPREIFDKYPTLSEVLFDAYQSEDPTVLPVALDTLGFIGETMEGKLCLTALGARYNQALDNIGNIVRNGVTIMKVRALICFSDLINIEKDPKFPATGHVDHRITLMTREWFRSLSSSPSSIEVLFSFCKNPFPDIKLAALTLLDSVCQHRWGEELVAETAGFIEFLLDRTVDDNKAYKEAKYDVIKRLANSEAFDSSITLRLQMFAEQGPHYFEPRLSVAMEDGEE